MPWTEHTNNEEDLRKNRNYRESDTNNQKKKTTETFWVHNEERGPGEFNTHMIYWRQGLIHLTSMDR